MSFTNTISPLAIVTSPPTTFKNSEKSTLLGTSLPTTSNIIPSVSLIDALSKYLCAVSYTHLTLPTKRIV